MITQYDGDTCVYLYIYVLCITCSMCMEEGAEVNCGGCEDGAKMCMEKEAEVNSGSCKDGTKICMEEGAEVNSGGCEDGTNYSGYKLYVVIMNFHVYVLHLVVGNI